MNPPRISPEWLKNGSRLFASIAACLATVIVFGQRGDLQNQLDSQANTSACRSRLTAEVNVATAYNQVAFSELLVTIATGGDAATAVTRITETGERLTKMTELRKAFEDDPTQRCPMEDKP